MVSMAVLIRTFSSGIHTHPVSWNCAYHLRMELSDDGCFPNFMRNCRWTVVPRQSFWIALYFNVHPDKGRKTTDIVPEIWRYDKAIHISLHLLVYYMKINSYKSLYETYATGWGHIKSCVTNLLQTVSETWLQRQMQICTCPRYEGV